MVIDNDKDRQTDELMLSKSEKISTRKDEYILR